MKYKCCGVVARAIELIAQASPISIEAPVLKLAKTKRPKKKHHGIYNIA